MKLVLQIAAGIILATALMTWITVSALAYITEREIQNIQATTERQLQENRQARETAERRRLQAEAQKRVEATAKREQEAQERAAALVKQKAWTAYYEDPQECLTPRSEQHAVECVNQRMRARREFEQQYRR